MSRAPPRTGSNISHGWRESRPKSHSPEHPKTTIFECSKSCPSPNSEDVWMKMLGTFKWLIVVIPEYTHPQTAGQSEVASVQRLTFEIVPHPRYRGDWLLKPRPRRTLRPLVSASRRRYKLRRVGSTGRGWGRNPGVQPRRHLDRTPGRRWNWSLGACLRLALGGERPVRGFFAV